MAQVVSGREAERRRIHVTSGGVGAWLSPYLGFSVRKSTTEPAGQISDDIIPNAMLVEQDPGTTLGVHFHDADQFQVALPSDALFGRMPVDRPIVHFAGAWSAYGPITAGTRPFKYFTLRNGWSPGPRYLPASLLELKARKRKQRSTYATIQGPYEQASVAGGVEVLMPQDETGLSAACFSVPANAAFRTPRAATSRGQYWLVLSGSCRVQGQELKPDSLWFVDPHDDAVDIAAGAYGLHLLGMQFPRRV